MRMCMCGQIGDCVTTAGRWLQAVGSAARSVSVYIAKNLGEGPNPVSQTKEQQDTLLVRGSDGCYVSDRLL